MLEKALLNEIQFDEKGLIPAIAQDVYSGEVLMVAYMNRESLEKTLESGRATYFSRSRQKLWVKGESSGHFQTVQEIRYDCDGDALLLSIVQEGVACHTGERSCFYRSLWQAEERGVGPEVIGREYDTIRSRGENPVDGSYTNYLLENGIDKVCKKVGEEATEVVIALKNNSKEELLYEAADLVYHLLVSMYMTGVRPEELFGEMAKRA